MTQKPKAKLTQEDIDALLNEDESDQESSRKQKPEEDYGEEFQKQIEEEYPEDQEEGIEEYRIDDEPEVESEIHDQFEPEEIEEEVGTPKSKLDKQNSGFPFKKDEDMSQAQSEFIESSRLNDDAFTKIGSKNIEKKQPAKPQPAEKRPIGKQSARTKQPAVKPKQQVKAKAQVKIKAQVKKVPPISTNKSLPSAVSESKKEKLSESEIKQRMKDIENMKQQMLKKKLEKQKKEEQVRRKEYEEAKKVEEERKDKNRKILEEQRLKKKNNESKVDSNPKQPQEDIKIPDKRTDFKYMEQKNERKENQKRIQKQIEQQNRMKLKKLNQNQPQQLKGEAKKAAFLQERKIQRERQTKLRQLQAKEEDTLILKQIKQEINECRRFNIDKNQQINRAEKNIKELAKKIKDKERLLYESQNSASPQDGPTSEQFSDLSPIEKFLHCFPQAHTCDQIFKLIDVNGDGVLTNAQILNSLKEMQVDAEIADKVYLVLDENSDGTVSNEQFVFLIELELKRQKDYRQIMGDLEVADPLDLEASILDMQAKIKYISAQMAAHQANNVDANYENKYDQLEKKIKKIENQYKKDSEDSKQLDTADTTANFIATLANQAVQLRNEKNLKTSFLERLRKRVKDNLADKNKLLASRVEEGLRLDQQLYNIKNEIQERELRYLSLKKIAENKKGYLERQTQQRKELEEAYRKTKEYQVTIADPGKKAKKAAENDQMQLLAAVLMIQRNYRRRKARGEFLKLKNQA